MVSERSPTPVIEPGALERLFAMGDGSLRVALCAQLQADFSRLRQAIAGSDGSLVGRAAHELKGLAATVGAHRLADMARGLDSIAESVAADARMAFVTPLHHEIGAVLHVLSSMTTAEPAE